jgi:SAM-dependent methyltransferase
MSDWTELYAPRDSQAGRKTSAEKSRGHVATPLSVAMDMVRKLETWPSNHGILLDAGCGDGVFTEAAIRVAAERGADPIDVSHRIVAIDISDPFDGVSTRMRALEQELGLEDDLCIQVVEGDLLSMPDPSGIQWVVGNPPYLESKRMSDALKEHVKHYCPTAARGAFDLYGAFLEVALNLVIDGAEAVLIVPNRILSAKWARDLRGSIVRNVVVDIEDLSGQDVFSGTAVYPVVLKMRKPVAGSRHEVPGIISTGGVFLPAGLLDRMMPGGPPSWPVLPSEPGLQDCIIRALTGSETVTLDRIVDVRWCVSFHRAGLRDDYVFSEEPKTPHARKFVGGVPYAGNREVGWLTIRWDGTWIDYDEEKAREDKNQLPPLSMFDGPKLVVCQNARRLRCAVDLDGGYVLKDTFLALIPRPGVPRWWLWWLALVLSSDIFHLFYESLNAGSRKGGGYLSFLPSTLSKLPIPKPTAGLYGSILDTRYTSCSLGDESEWSNVNAMVSALYGLDEKMREALSRSEFPPRD